MKVTQLFPATAVADIQDLEPLNSELGQSQWALIHDLERGYRGKSVPGTQCKFEDDNWFSLEDLSTTSRTGINWKTLTINAPALLVLVKTMMFEILRDRRLRIGSAAGIVKGLRRDIIPLIESKRLLSGSEGSTLLGLSHLTEDDVRVMLDVQLLSASSAQKFYVRCYDLVAFCTYANHVSHKAPHYQMRARLPWQKSGEPIKKWAQRRAADLKVIFPPSEGYEPLPAETVQPLTEKSLNLIEVYFDHFAEIAPLVAAYSHRESYEKQYLLELCAKYRPIFGKLKALPDLDVQKSPSKIARTVFGWLRELLFLVRVACINVILLTTGLRNSDVRALKVGSCRTSGRMDMLFYLHADMQKTSNTVLLPVPGQTDLAIRLLEKIKLTTSSDLIDASLWPAMEEVTTDDDDGNMSEVKTHLKYGDTLNSMIRDFAEHFNIPFTSPVSGELYSAHCYRTTVAGWLGSASNLSLLLVRRLFGHSNNVMPTVYLNNNPAFVIEREAQRTQANAETARQMAMAASQGRLAGVKGEQLERGYQQHKSRMESDRQKSHSLTEAEIFTSFKGILEQRINGGSVCAFLTPFGVQCMRNPSDTNQAPCAQRAHRSKTKEIASDILKHMSDINPQHCIGTSCSEAMLGPWSTSVLETLNWYHALLRHQLGDAFAEQHFVESAQQFIKQYEAPLKKVFGVSALTDEGAASGAKTDVKD
jgi:hypothetical protein